MKTLILTSWLALSAVGVQAQNAEEDLREQIQQRLERLQQQATQLDRDLAKVVKLQGKLAASAREAEQNAQRYQQQVEALEGRLQQGE